MINNAYAAAVATCSLDGVPNVVSCSMKQAWDAETVMISDQFMKKTLANIQANPRMALSVWDETHGYQVKGTVIYENDGPNYEAISSQVHQILSSMGYDFRSKGVCWLRVEEVYSITPGPDAGELIS
ncbi:MAG: pyridoxamine 5'-phosphate oxidase family protein [Coriobacteriales bacterium]|nr:pyridoxamine 5'-phosphate oxidase family protein [Coriobacteriales bacterium]